MFFDYEVEIWDSGVELIAGVDEAGVGPLAGPVVAAAVILPRDFDLTEVNDSKKLSEKKRERIAEQIKQYSISWAVGIADVDEIDTINIYHASLQAMRRAVYGLTPPPDYILVDARTIPDCSISQRGIVKGDQLSPNIAAASIIAKTTRDAMMKNYHELYPDYGFAAHKGYPTKAHYTALSKLGPLPIHRKSFTLVKS